MADIVDAHQHCWQVNRPECQWPTPDLSKIYRDFTPRQLVDFASPRGVVGSILVQSQPNEADTDFLLTLARSCDFVLGVVGWVNLKSADASRRIANLAQQPKLRGLRPMLQALESDAWIDDPALQPAVKAMQSHGLIFDALVYTRHLPHLFRFAQRYPELTIVIDHAAKPPIASGEREGWRKHMAKLAELPNTYCKLSGLLTEAAPAQTLAELQPWVDDLLDWFGPLRMLWGSDWPVVNLVSSYGEWLDLTRELLSGLGEPEQSAIYSGTARHVYHLECAGAAKQLP